MAVVGTNGRTDELGATEAQRGLGRPANTRCVKWSLRNGTRKTTKNERRGGEKAVRERTRQMRRTDDDDVDGNAAEHHQSLLQTANANDANAPRRPPPPLHSE